jgi:hypothetical protein
MIIGGLTCFTWFSFEDLTRFIGGIFTAAGGIFFGFKTGNLVLVGYSMPTFVAGYI